MNVTALVPPFGVTDLAQQKAVKSATEAPASQVALNNPQAPLPDSKAKSAGPEGPVVDAFERLIGVGTTNN